MNKYAYQQPSSKIISWEPPSSYRVEVHQEANGTWSVRVPHSPPIPCDTEAAALREGWYHHSARMHRMALEGVRGRVRQHVGGVRAAASGPFRGDRPGYAYREDTVRRQTVCTWKYDKPRTGEKLASLHAELVADGIACRKTAATVVVPWPEPFPSREEFFAAMDSAQAESAG